MRTDPSASGPGGPSSTPRSTGERPIGILYENAAWLTDLFAALGRRGLAFEPLWVGDAAYALDEAADHLVLLNRASPSSYLRGHGGAIRYAQSYLRTAAERGVRVVNGAESFRLETSKVEQLLLLERLGVRTPRTLVFDGREAVRHRTRDFPFPAVLKPDTGGSGAYVRRVESAAELEHVLDRERDLFAPDHLLLLQEHVAAPDGTVVRFEFVDGELVYAMRVRATNTFNLCPAEACERPPADASPESPAPAVEFLPLPAPSPDAVAQAREIVRAAHLDVGGVEYVEVAGRGRVFFDINATSVYRRDVSAALGVDGLSMLVDFLEREQRKELAKHAGLPVRDGLRVEPALRGVDAAS